MSNSKKRKSESTDNVDTKVRAILEMREVFGEVHPDNENKSNEQKQDKVRKLEPVEIIRKVSKKECSKGRQLKPFQCKQCRFVNSMNKRAPLERVPSTLGTRNNLRFCEIEPILRNTRHLCYTVAPVN